MSKIVAFSKYIFYSVGGAEKSMYEILKKKQMEGDEIKLIGVDDLVSFKASQFKITDEYNWGVEAIKMKYQFNRFLFFEYFLNRKSIIKKFQNLEADVELLTYGFYAAAAAIGFAGKKSIYLRSESDLGFNENYYTGIKKVLKNIYKIIEWPFFKIYVKDLKQAYSKSEVVCNSEWMKTQCQIKFGVTGKVEYPGVNKDRLKSNFNLNKDHVRPKDRGVVFVGDSVFKGIDIFVAISKLMPEIPFYVFSRAVNKDYSIKNLHYKQWAKDSSIPFTYAKIVLVPSKWYEAYGRVSIEAQLLGIPVLVSNRGGLPETVDATKGQIVEDYLTPTTWVKKINEIVNDQN